jgi:hypothetical protein
VPKDKRWEYVKGQIAQATAFRVVLIAPVVTAAAIGATPLAAASGPTLGEPCSDYDKLANDANTGEQLHCDPNIKQWWNQTGPIIDVHTIGTSCAGYPSWQNARSPDDYLIWCHPNGPGISSGASGPAWQQFLQSHPEYADGGPTGPSLAPPGSTWEKYTP